MPASVTIIVQNAILQHGAALLLPIPASDCPETWKETGHSAWSG